MLNPPGLSGEPYDLRLRVWHSQYHASRLIKGSFEVLG